MQDINEFTEKLRQSSQLVIFGAGIMAFNVAKCLLEKPYELLVTCCLVSDLKANPPSVLGIPVIDFAIAERKLSKEAVILVGAAAGRNLPSMQKSLLKNGYTNLICFTYEGDLFSWLREGCYRESCLLQGKPYQTLEEALEKIQLPLKAPEKSIQIYTAKCHLDKPLQEDPTRFSWETSIQVGAALTEERICAVCDNTGEHISQKNRQYCEVTALYWIWKNDTSDYVGLGHYRRHFELTKQQLRKLAASDIDVVLTVPILDIPDVETVYRRDHVGKDWEVMQKAVKTLSPDYMEALECLEKSSFYHAYNMFIMRREILEDYCRWLFPILFYCEAYCEEKPDPYQNRYIGFLAEHLMAVYFLHKEEHYKIVHARKHFAETIERIPKG